MEEKALIAFLRARFDEVRQRAEACATAYPPPWEVSDRGWMARIYADPVTAPANPDVTHVPIVVELDQGHAPAGAWLSEYLDHIAAHDPADVIADVAAKHLIVDAAAITIDTYRRGTVLDFAWETLRQFARPFADHPDYQEAWRP